MDNHFDLTLYYHPLASFCHKVLVALYENQTPFEGKIVDLADEASSGEMLSFWAVGKIPVLRDRKRNQTVPETSVIIEYLDQHHPGNRQGRVRLLPSDPDHALEVRLWDRFFDLYVNAPMGKIVTDRLRPPGRGDPVGVDEAVATLERAYVMLEKHLQSRTWAAGGAFSMAECAAAPALFYADIVLPFSGRHPSVTRYFEHLLERPSVAQALAEAQPYFRLFPLRDQIPARFLKGAS